MAAALKYDSSFCRPQLWTSCIPPLGSVEGGRAGHTSALSCMATASSKQVHHHTSRHYSTIWCTWSEPPTMQARRFASISTLAGATSGQSAILPTGAGSQAVVERTLPRPGHALHQWPHDLQQVHTTLRPVSSHHSTTSELTPLYDQPAHITLRPASSHHSTTSQLTPLYDQPAHTTL